VHTREVELILRNGARELAFKRRCGCLYTRDSERSRTLHLRTRWYVHPLKQSTLGFLSYLAASHKGSVSAEHGIGAMKTHALHYSKSGVSIEWMKKLKQLFDPHGIMNPGKVLEMP
jgi:hypothetical protein